MTHAHTTTHHEAPLRVGWGRVEITPPLAVPHLGFQPRHRAFHGVHDRLYARAVSIRSGAESVLVVSADLIGFTGTLLGPGRDFVAEMRTRLATRTAIPAPRIMLAASHSHSTPDTIGIRPLRGTPAADKWIGEMMDGIEECAGQAVENTFPAWMRIATGEMPGYSRNRRGEPLSDDDVDLVIFESIDRAQRVLLAHYTCHPIIVQTQDQVSGDYVGVFEQFMEKNVAGIKACLFLQGACGDINPIIDDSRDFADVRRMGLALAGKCTELLGNMGAGQLDGSPLLIGSAGEVLELDSRTLPDLEAYRVMAGPAATDELKARMAEGTGTYRAEIQVLRIGNLLLAGIPGEPFCRMGLELRQRCRPYNCLTVGCANGYLGYFVPHEPWANGGYETAPGSWSKVGPESFARILDTAARLAHAVKD